MPPSTAPSLPWQRQQLVSRTAWARRARSLAGSSARSGAAAGRRRQRATAVRRTRAAAVITRSPAARAGRGLPKLDVRGGPGDWPAAGVVSWGRSTAHVMDTTAGVAYAERTKREDGSMTEAEWLAC